MFFQTMFSGTRPCLRDALFDAAYFAERDRSFRRIVTVAQREVLRA